MNFPVIGDAEIPLAIAGENNEPVEPTPYHPGKRVEPPNFPLHVDVVGKSKFELCLSRNSCMVHSWLFKFS